MKKKIRIIINPISGSGKHKKAEEAIRKFLDSNSFDAEIILTKQKGDFTTLSRQAVEQNYAAVIVVGGDGSINEAVQALNGSNTALGIVPFGSGNGLARHLKLPSSLKKSIECINRFQFQKIDTANVNDYTFASISGFGFDAHIAQLFIKTKKRGLWNYVKITFSAFSRFSNQDYTYILDGKRFSKKAFMIVIANSNQFGNDFIISPKASLIDGLLDICVVQKPKMYQIPFFLFQVLFKKAHLSKLIEIQKGKAVQLELKNSTYMNIDGESLELKGTIRISINPLSLLVIS
jgi:YegS/Rv2252/BmrU family lipid kinase